MRHQRRSCSSAREKYAETQARPSSNPHGVSVNSPNAGVHHALSGVGGGVPQETTPTIISWPRSQPAHCEPQTWSLPLSGAKGLNAPRENQLCVEEDRPMSESEGMCPSREELQGPRCGPLGGCKLHKEESVLRIRKVSQAVKKASAECRLRLCVCVCGGEVQGGAGGGVGGVAVLWEEVAGAGFCAQQNPASAEDAGTGDLREAGATVWGSAHWDPNEDWDDDGDRGTSSRLCLPRDRVTKKLPTHEPRRVPPHSASPLPQTASSMLATCSHHWVMWAAGIINPSHELTLPPTHLAG